MGFAEKGVGVPELVISVRIFELKDGVP